MPPLNLKVKVGLDLSDVQKSVNKVKSDLTKQAIPGPASLGGPYRGHAVSMDTAALNLQAMRRAADDRLQEITKTNLRRLGTSAVYQDTRPGLFGQPRPARPMRAESGYDLVHRQLLDTDKNYRTQVSERTAELAATRKRPHKGMSYEQMASREIIKDMTMRQDTRVMGAMDSLGASRPGVIQGTSNGRVQRDLAELNKLKSTLKEIAEAEKEIGAIRQKVSTEGTKAAREEQRQREKALRDLEKQRREQEKLARAKLSREDRNILAGLDRSARGREAVLTGRGSKYAPEATRFTARATTARGRVAAMEAEAASLAASGKYIEADAVSARAETLRMGVDAARARVASASSRRTRAVGNVADTTLRERAVGSLRGLQALAREGGLDEATRTTGIAQVNDALNAIDARLAKYDRDINRYANRGQIEKQSEVMRRREALAAKRESYVVTRSRVEADLQSRAEEGASNAGRLRGAAAAREAAHFSRYNLAGMRGQDFVERRTALEDSTALMRRLSNARNLNKRDRALADEAMKQFGVTDRADLFGAFTDVRQQYRAEARARERAGALAFLRPMMPGVFGGVGGAGVGGSGMTPVASGFMQPFQAMNRLGGRVALTAGASIYGLGAAGAGAAALGGSLKLFAEAETQQNAIAGMTAAFTQFVNLQGEAINQQEQFNKAVDYSRTVYKDLRKDAVETILTTREMTEYFTSGAPMLMGRGMSIAQSREFIRDTAVLGKSMALPQAAILSDVRDYTTGRVNSRTQTAMMLGIDAATYNEKFRSDPAAAFQLVRDSSQGFRKAIERQGELPETLFSRFADTMQQTGIAAGASAFTVLEPTLTRLLEQLNAGEGPMIQFVEGLAKIADGLLRAAEAVGPFLAALDISDPNTVLAGAGMAMLGYGGARGIASGASAMFGAAGQVGGVGALRAGQTLIKNGQTVNPTMTSAAAQSASGLSSLSTGLTLAVGALGLFVDSLHNAAAVQKAEVKEAVKALQEQRRSQTSLNSNTPEGKLGAQAAIDYFLQTGATVPDAITMRNSQILSAQAALRDQEAGGWNADAWRNYLAKIGVDTAAATGAGALAGSITGPGAVVGAAVLGVGGLAYSAYTSVEAINSGFLSSEYQKVGSPNLQGDINPALLREVGLAFERGYRQSSPQEQDRFSLLRSLGTIGPGDPRYGLYSDAELLTFATEREGLQSRMTYLGLRELYGAAKADEFVSNTPRLKASIESDEQSRLVGNAAQQSSLTISAAIAGQNRSNLPEFAFAQRESLAQTLAMIQNQQAATALTGALIASPAGTPEAQQAMLQYEQSIVQTELARQQEIASIEETRRVRQIEIQLIREKNRLTEQELSREKTRAGLAIQYRSGAISGSDFIRQSAILGEQAIGDLRQAGQAEAAAAAQRAVTNYTEFGYTPGSGNYGTGLMPNRARLRSNKGVSLSGVNAHVLDAASALAESMGVSLSISSAHRPGAKTASGNLSRHGAGDALDINGFYTEDGGFHHVTSKRGAELANQYNALALQYGFQASESGNPHSILWQTDKGHYDHIHLSAREPLPAVSGGGRSAQGLEGYKKMAYDAARKAGIDPSLFMGLIQTESNWDPRARSSAGARGLGQLMPGTARSLGVTDSYDPAQNLEGSARYLAQMLKQFDGDERLALAAYNAGPGAVRRAGGIPNFKETKAYVPKVLAARKQYQSGGGGFTTSASQGNTPTIIPGGADPTKARELIAQRLSQAIAFAPVGGGMQDMVRRDIEQVSSLLSGPAGFLQLDQLAVVLDGVREARKKPVYGPQQTTKELFLSIAKNKFPSVFNRNVDVSRPAADSTPYVAPQVTARQQTITDDLGRLQSGAALLSNRLQVFQETQKLGADLYRDSVNVYDRSSFAEMGRFRNDLNLGTAVGYSSYLQAQAESRRFGVSLQLRQLDDRRAELAMDFAMRNMVQNKYSGNDLKAASARYASDLQILSSLQMGLEKQSTLIGSDIPQRVTAMQAMLARNASQSAYVQGGRVLTASAALDRLGFSGQMGQVQELQLQAQQATAFADVEARRILGMADAEIMTYTGPYAEFQGSLRRTIAQSQAEKVQTQGQSEAARLNAEAALLVRSFEAVRQVADAMSNSLSVTSERLVSDYMDNRSYGRFGDPAPTLMDDFDRTTRRRQERMIDNVALQQAERRQKMQQAVMVGMRLAGHSPQSINAFLSSTEFAQSIQAGDAEIADKARRAFVEEQTLADQGRFGFEARDRIARSVAQGFGALASNPFAVLSSGYDGRLNVAKQFADPFLEFKNQQSQNEMGLLTRLLTGGATEAQATAAGYTMTQGEGGPVYTDAQGRTMTAGQLRQELTRRQGYNMLGMMGGQFLGQAVGGAGAAESSLFGAQLGGLLGPSLLGGMGALGGPIGMVAGGLLGGLFGRRRSSQEDQETARWQKSVESLLENVDRSLRPVRDMAQTINRDALFGGASRYISGRNGLAEGLAAGTI